MAIFEDIATFRQHHSGCVATIGKYDRMHLGHQQVLRTLCERARAHGLPAVAVLSEPQPEEFFAPELAPARLTHFQDKIEFLTQVGVDAVYRLNFDRALSEVSAESFVDDFLVAGLGIKTLIVGDDFRFGKARQGDFQLLREKGAEAGFEVIKEEPCRVNGTRVSSTLVRESLQQGDCERARQLLGRYYSISGQVIDGKKLGRELGAPTANLALEMARLPVSGIYSVLVELNGNILQGIASAGYNPTVETGEVPRLEVNIFDFNEDIYGEHIKVSFVSKLRDEVRFDDLQALKKQIALDIEQARNFFASGAVNAAGQVNG